ncbi:hypothetical protein K431DRAFT_288145 [Polychaeton citri CBS 116435]|uniref:Uncharacterized protein n=1 Tax=Polychaeton citri CBS 116435 TaxID=1314669 RepID=A0A9P4Q4D3_9PEZI|nr:hypothetical protein K431DRAFT_288145 [Polychaeton citri CBS 116435]
MGDKGSQQQDDEEQQQKSLTEQHREHREKYGRPKPQQEYEPVPENGLLQYNQQGEIEHARTTTQQKKLQNLVDQQRREQGFETNRSRSSSRRDRRKRIRKAVEENKYMKTNSLEALEEADANGELKSMQPFERIGPDSTSMDGPVTKARADRGEIPVRGSNPNQPYYNPRTKPESALKDTDGLKLSLDANLDIEIELKASIRGDLTLSLYA